MDILSEQEILPIKLKRDELQKELEFVRDRKIELDTAIKQIDKVLALVGVVVEGNGKPKPKPRKERVFVSEQRKQEILGVFKLTTTPLSCKDVADRIGVSTTTARYAIQALRAEGVLRKVGERPNRIGRATELYSVYG